MWLPKAQAMQRQWVGGALTKSSRQKKIASGKTLIPLPPTGFASLFCATPGGGANGAPAQARCGVCGRGGNCTVCKVLQRSAAALHCTQIERDRGWFVGGHGLQGGALKTGVLLSFHFLNSSHQVSIRRVLGTVSICLKAPAHLAFRSHSPLHRLTSAEACLGGYLVGLKKTSERERVEAVFQERRGERVILVSGAEKWPGALTARDFGSLP